MPGQRGSLRLPLLLLGVLLVAAVIYLLASGPAPEPAPTPEPEPAAGAAEEPPAPAEASPAEAVPVAREPDLGGRRTELAPSEKTSGTIFGLVMTEGNAPVAGAKVVFRRILPPSEAFFAAAQGEMETFTRTTNRDGRYWFENLPLHHDYEVWVSHPDYAGAYGQPVTVLEEDQTIQPVILKPGYILSGRVTDTGGNPLAAEIILRQRGGRAEVREDREQELAEGRRIEARAAQDGAFEVHHLATGIWSLTVRHEGYADHVEPSLVVQGEERIWREIQLDSEHTISGRVVNDRLEPVAGATVYVSRSRPRPLFSAQAESSEDGSFLLRGLPEGIYTVTAEAPGYSRASLARIEADSEGLEVVLHVRGSVSGRVTDAAGAPVGRFALELFLVNRGTAAFNKLGNRREYRSPDGSYRFADIEPGTYRLLATAPGFAPTYSPGFTVEREEVQGVDIQLGRGGRVIGRITDPAGEPLAGAFVRVHGRDWSEQNQYGLFGGKAPDPNNVPEQVAETGADGRFSLDNAFPGTIRLEFGHPAFLSQTQVVEIVEGGVEDVGTIGLRRGGTITGVGLKPDGSPLAGGNAFLTRQEQSGFGWFSRNARLDSQGRFRFAGLPAGTYRVVVTPAEGGGFSLFPETESNSRTLFVAEGQEVELRLTAQ
ncbi:MAG: carboxypeptidase regulatory-like domain-containing protein [Planctomycetota bacterium]|nr:MAG: carboxypeptidase regulatory-like domain-containing protein [Planctomycetota bacterium]